MIRTYLINRSELENINYSDSILSPGRISKIEKLKRDEDKQLSACAELLLIYALKQQIEDLSLPLDIEADERGKLRLTNIPLYFNYSHAKEYAACSVSDEPIGVDIEYFRVNELMSPDRILYPDEYNLLSFISNPNEKKKFFYECWVAKESYLKNLGIGLIVRPRDFSVNEGELKIHKPDPQQLKDDHSLEDNLSYLKQRYVHVLEPGEVRGTDWKFDAGYRVAVCSMKKDTDSIARLVKAADINKYI